MIKKRTLTVDNNLLIMELMLKSAYPKLFICIKKKYCFKVQEFSFSNWNLTLDIEC